MKLQINGSNTSDFIKWIIKIWIITPSFTFWDQLSTEVKVVY